MIDPSAKTSLLESIVPATITERQKIIDIISSVYIKDTIKFDFNADLSEKKYFREKSKLARLSIASSILNSENKNAFLIAECEDILLKESDFKLSPNINSVLSLSDIAFYYHVASYDANAAIIANDIIDILESIPNIQINIKKYYENYANFIRGNFESFSYIDKKDIANSTQSVIFSFLNECLSELINYYADAIPINDTNIKKISALNEIYRTSILDWQTGIEINHINEFFKIAGKKALFPKLNDLNIFNQEYISKTQFKFVSPPVEDFIEKYFIRNSSNAVINTPTGSGKSFLAELAISKNLTNGWVLYLAPTNALCTQISHDLHDHLGDLVKNEVDVILGLEEYSKIYFSNKKILVTTPEKALILLKINPDDFKTCNMVILDECHILDSESRGVVAESVLGMVLYINSNINVIFMSALLENPLALKSWLDETSTGSTTIIDNSWKPTRSSRFLVTLDTKQTLSSKETCLKKISVHADVESPWNSSTNKLISLTLPLEIKNAKPGKIPTVNEIAGILSQKLDSVGKRTLLFVAPNKHFVFSIGSGWVNDSKEKTILNNYERALFEISEYELGTKSLVKEIIEEKGVTIHSAAMLNSEQDAALHIFNRQNSGVKTIIATGTLAQGMNLSIDTVVVAGTRRNQGKKNIPLVDEILNAMGRAARANYFIHGSTFIIPNLNLVDNSSSKQEMINASVCIEKSDASTRIESPLIKLVKKIEDTGEMNQAEMELISILPSDVEVAKKILKKAWGTHNAEEKVLDRITNRIVTIQNNYINTYGIDHWVIEAASIACLPPKVAIDFYLHIKNDSFETSFVDNYRNWLTLLLSLLGKCDNKSIIDNLEKESDFYPCNQSHSHLCLKMDKWITGNNYYEIGKRCENADQNDSWKRSSATYHLLPKMFNWIKKVPYQVSRYAGLLFALQEKWVENEILSIPDWYRESNKLSTLSLGIKYGVDSPESLACYENIIHERLASNDLGKLNIEEMSDPADKDSRYQYAKEIKNRIIHGPLKYDNNLADNMRIILTERDSYKNELPF